MKKLLALALSLALLCAMAPLAIADEPITVTVIGPSSATNSSNEGYKLVQDWILENTGVLINQITLDGTNNTEKQNALLTGDTTIDVWWGDWMQYSEYGMIRTINEYLDAIPNTMKTWENFGGLSTVTDSEGNVWGLPRNCNRVFYQSFIREDFLKQLGYTEETYPTTFEEFEKYNDELLEVGFKAQFAGALANPSTRFVNALVYAAVGIMGALFAVAGTLSVGQLSCFLTYANQYTKPFNEVTGVLTQLQTGIAAAGRVFEVLEADNEIPDNSTKELEHCKGNVKIENVNFSYTKEKPLITNFSLNVKSGSHIAIVGPTGCGKTTFINLLMRFYDTDSGKISIDGVDIMDITRDNLRKCYGMVLQDSWLFNGTIMENLRYGNENATEEEVITAAKAAYAHSFIRRMSDGYNTVISEDGGNLSQGQKQLLCIARAMLTNPSILILDEATSSIDTLTEIRVQKAFAKMMRGKTSFVVAHRLSTIKESDVILVMKDGNIIEQGTHEELLAKGGFYNKLYNSQFAKQ